MFVPGGTIIAPGPGILGIQATRFGCTEVVGCTVRGGPERQEERQETFAVSALTEASDSVVVIWRDGCSLSQDFAKTTSIPTLDIR